jgi:hypothetical protein
LALPAAAQIAPAPSPVARSGRRHRQQRSLHRRSHFSLRSGEPQDHRCRAGFPTLDAGVRKLTNDIGMRVTGSPPRPKPSLGSWPSKPLALTKSTQKPSRARGLEGTAPGMLAPARAKTSSLKFAGAES